MTDSLRLKMNKNLKDKYITTEILNKFEKLKINTIVSTLHDVPTEDTKIEFYPSLTEAKDSLERLLRVAVLLGNWLDNKNVDMKTFSNKELAHNVLNSLDSLHIEDIIPFSKNEQEDLENILSLINYLSKIQFYLTKWLVYLYQKYTMSITNMINFIFRK